MKKFIVLFVVVVMALGCINSFAQVSTTGTRESRTHRPNAPANLNPCTNGTYPKPAGCYQHSQPQPHHYSQPQYQHNRRPTRNDYNNVMQNALTATQRLIIQERTKNSWRLAQNISNNLISMLNDAANNYSLHNRQQLAEKFWRIADMIYLPGLVNCMQKKIYNNPRLYDYLNRKNNRLGVIGALPILDQCTPYVSIPQR